MESVESNMTTEPLQKPKDQRIIKQVADWAYDCNSPALGTGSFGIVFKGWEIKNPRNFVAIKLIPKTYISKSSTRHLQAALKEIEVLRQLKGEHLLEFRDAVRSSSGNIYIITAYCEEGNLRTYVMKQGGTLSVRKALQILTQIAQALCDIDLKNRNGEKIAVMHRDIKPENILMKEGKAILADFGFAKFVLDDTKGQLRDQTKLGTVAYMSPQLLKLAPYSFKCDIWAMGVVTYELIFGKRPWDGPTSFALLQKTGSQPLVFPKSIPKVVEDLLRSMLEYEEDKRADWETILTHPAMEEFGLIAGKGDVKTNKQNIDVAEVITIQTDQPKADAEGEKKLKSSDTISTKDETNEQKIDGGKVGLINNDLPKADPEVERKPKPLYTNDKKTVKILEES